jgi:nucleoside-diphosphate-sugar epimerase
MSIYLSGSSGFVGRNFISFIGNRIPIRTHVRGSDFLINEKIVIHLAGKAHDLKKTANPAEYYETNTELTKKILDSFLISEAKVFIMLSSVKAVADSVNELLTEEHFPDPQTDYGKSKLLAEQYILSKKIPSGKKVYILRPCMIHGPGNKGNLNLLFKLVSKVFFWPLGAFSNKRSFCSIDNLLFVFNELIEREDIPSGLYNMSDDEAISTNEIISLIAQSKNKKTRILNISKKIILIFSKLGDKLNLPLNSERLQKLTESYIVSNLKIKDVIGKPFPMRCKQGLLKTFKSFN